jgi:HK97 family phage prohead protease
MTKKIELRSNGEIRAVQDNGVFEGYIAVWNTVDSYNSRFEKGAFAKTIQERGDKVKVLYDHDDLIGKSLEIREDDYGVFVRGQLTLGVAKADDTYLFLKDKTLKELSFGFRTVKSAIKEGVLAIQEVELYEYSPVLFPSNTNAAITNVRSTDFATSFADERLGSERWQLCQSLHETICDIWWTGDYQKPDEILGAIDKAITDFHAAYLDFSQRWLAMGERSSPHNNALSNALHGVLEQRNLTIDELAKNSQFTVEQLRKFQKGMAAASETMAQTLSPEFLTAWREQLNSDIRGLKERLANVNFNEILTPLEKRKLVQLTGQKQDDELAKLTEFYKAQSGAKHE